MENYQSSTSKTIEILNKRLNEASNTIEHLSEELQSAQKELLDTVDNLGNDTGIIKSHLNEISNLKTENERLVSININDQKIAMIYEKQIKSLEDENIA